MSDSRADTARDAALGQAGRRASSVGRRRARARRGINVAGSGRPSPIQGFGRMWQKTYRVRLPGTAHAAERDRDVEAALPRLLARGQPLLRAADRHRAGRGRALDLTMPGGMKLSTGVMVMYADDESFTLMTPQGHMFAGWITFSAFEDDGETVAQAQVLMRASRPALRDGHDAGRPQAGGPALGAHAALARAGIRRRGRGDDRVGLRRQAAPVVEAANVWHNAGIRSGMLHARRPAPAGHAGRSGGG